ncbi:hypothetical protein Gasu2_41550 [Galdieria sulphuraria]|nr:hypothetical protein Gasu2_41550 [Galdieria sulphuraria]
MSLFDLEEQYTFYASYHSNLVNKLVHILFVPIILWSTLVFVSFTGVLFPKAQENLVRFAPILASTFPLNGALLLASSYIFYYEVLNAKAGFPASILVTVLLFLANLFVRSVSVKKAILWALLLNITGWIAQFIGHGVFEKRRPALLDNLIQAFATAPLFIVLESNSEEVEVYAAKQKGEINNLLLNFFCVNKWLEMILKRDFMGGFSPMNGFSFRLLDNEVTWQWLMCRKELYIPAHMIESAVGICGDTCYGYERERMHFLMRPIGVVDNIMLGLKLGATYPFALPKDFDGVPLCRRFAVDLENLEKLEFHWFSNGTLLVDWMQFPSEQERLRYLVLFEAPPIGKRPAKLLRSTEVVSLKDSTFSGRLGVETGDGELHELSAATFSLSLDERNIFDEGVSYISHALGLFHGSLRITIYGEDSKPYTYDQIVPIETGIHIVRNAKTEYLKMLEMKRHCVYYPMLDIGQLYGIEKPSGKLKMLLEREHYMCIYRLYDEKIVQAALRRRWRRQQILKKRQPGLSSNALKNTNSKDSECLKSSCRRRNRKCPYFNEKLPLVSCAGQTISGTHETNGNVHHNGLFHVIEEELGSEDWKDNLLDQSIEQDLLLYYEGNVIRNREKSSYL